MTKNMALDYQLTREASASHILCNYKLFDTLASSALIGLLK